MRTLTSQKFLLAYSTLLTLILGTTFLVGATLRAAKAAFGEIDVQRINVREPDGTLRMVISNRTRLPGIIVRGKEKPFARPQAGMIFYNDEASENGGLIFGGRMNEKGDVVDSGGSLSFDRYGANQIVQLIGVHDKEDRMAGLVVVDSPPNAEAHRRIWVGSGEDGAARIELRDANGKKRIVMQVGADGDSSLIFLDSTGKVMNQMVPARSQ